LISFLGKKLNLSRIGAVITRENGMCPYFYLHSFDYLEMVISWNCLSKFNLIEKEKTHNLLCDSNRWRGRKDDDDKRSLPYCPG
jgi:hypothetical protein